MTDLHCHILPAIDDGSPDLDISVEMAAMAKANGTSTIVATPHCNVSDMDYRARCVEILQKVDELQQILDDEGIELRILPGMEIFARDNLGELLDSGNFLTLGGSKYLLIEFDFEEDTVYMEQCFETVREKGLVPVMAHPERYIAIQNSPESIVPFFRNGTVIQVNKGSIFGAFGSEAGDTVKWILGNGLAHIMGSDAHGADFRTPVLSVDYEYISEHYSDYYANILFSRNPARIISNRDMVST